MKEIIATEKVPGAIGPYSQANAFDRFVFTSGQIPLNPADGSVAGDTVEAQSRQALDNLVAVLEAAGSCAANVVKTTCFLSDMKNFAAFNAVYAEYFPGNAPARSCVEVSALPKGVLVEVEAVAIR